jgi:hypothetical protein
MGTHGEAERGTRTQSALLEAGSLFSAWMQLVKDLCVHLHCLLHFLSASMSALRWSLWNG